MENLTQKRKLTDIEFEKLRHSRHIYYDLLDYDISEDDVLRFMKKSLDLLTASLKKRPTLLSESAEIEHCYKTMVETNFALITEYETLQTIYDAISFFKRISGKIYSFSSMVSFYKNQLFDKAQDCADTLANFLSYYSSDVIVGPRKLNENDLDAAVGGVKPWMRKMSAALLGLNLLNCGNSNTLINAANLSSSQMLSSAEMNDLLPTQKLMSAQPSDYGLPKKKSKKNEKKSSMLATGGMLGVGGFLSGVVVPWVEELPVIGGIAKGLKLPHDITQFKGWWAKTQDNLKDMQEEGAKIFGKRVDGANLASRGRGTNDFQGFVASKIFGQDIAVQEIMDLGVNPFLRHAILSVRTAQDGIIQPPNINVLGLFGAPGTGKTKTFEILVQDCFHGQLPWCKVQVSSFASASASFEDWLSKQKDYMDMIGKAKDDSRMCIMLFDELDKLSDSKRSEIFEYIRTVYDNGKLPPAGDLSATDLDRAIIFLASNEPNPRSRGSTKQENKDFDRPDIYKKQRVWDSSIISRMSGFVDFKQLYEVDLATIFGGHARKIRKAYCLNDGINVELDREFCYWAVSELPPEVSLEKGARYVSTTLIPMVTAELDKQLPKIKKLLKTAIEKKKNPADLHVRMKWVSAAQFEAKIGRPPRTTVSAKGNQYAPIIYIAEEKSVTKKSTVQEKVNWENKNSVLNNLDSWHSWVVRQYSKANMQSALDQLDSLYDRVNYLVLDGHYRTGSSKKECANAISEWIHANGTPTTYTAAATLLKTLDLPPVEDPSTALLDEILNPNGLEGPGETSGKISRVAPKTKPESTPSQHESVPSEHLSGEKTDKHITDGPKNSDNKDVSKQENNSDTQKQPTPGESASSENDESADVTETPTSDDTDLKKKANTYTKIAEEYGAHTAALLL